MKNSIIFRNNRNGLLRFLLFTFIITHSSFIISKAQIATCNTPGIIAKWNFDSETVQCNGGGERPVPNRTTPMLGQNATSYCPQINAGCGIGKLGSKGHQNSKLYENALCLLNFYNSQSTLFTTLVPYDPASTTWTPLDPVNIYAEYILPAGKIGCFSSFSLKVLQKQFSGTQAGVNFEKQGVAVYRNGIQIYSQTQNIMAANINGTAMTFNFSGTDFCSDGSESVTFRIYFGLVHQLNAPGEPGTPAQTGYDDICMNGTCGGPNGRGLAKSPTCTAGIANDNGSITMFDYGATDKYDYNLGTTYTGSQTYATATAVPAGGVIVNNLANPAGASATYTVRLFDAAGCFSDIRVVLKQTVCPPFCNQPTGAVATVTEPTCVSTTPQNNGSIAITGVTGGDRVAISVGGVFTAATTYATATALAGGAYTFTTLANPVGGSQLYTVRIWNAVEACYIDKIVELTGDDCAVCKKGKSEVWSSSLGDPDSTPANDVTGEDDQAIAEFCLGTKKVDLALTKSVSPATGTVCGAGGAGTVFTWTVTLNNTGDLAATDIQIADILPEGLNLVSSSVTLGSFYGNAGWILPTLAAGGSATLTITTTALKAGVFKNVVEVVDYFPLNDPDSTPNNFVTTEDDYAEASITVTGASPPVISKEFSPMLTKTNTATRLTIKITNNESTPITLTNDFVDTFPTSPAAMVLASTPNLQSVGLTIPVVGITATAGSGSITIPKGTVLSPGLNQISVEVTVPSNGNYCNTIAAGVLKTTSGDNCLAAEACILANSTFTMAPVVKKTMNPAIIQTGQSATLTISVENRNNSVMTLNKAFVDYLPAGLLASGSPTSSCGSLTVTTENSNKEIKIASGGTIAANSTCTITVNVTSATAGTYCNVIPMNAVLTTVGTNTNLGNEDIAEACVKVTGSPCTAVGTVTFGYSPASPVLPSAAVTVTATATGISNNSVLQWSSAAGVFSNVGINPTIWTAPAIEGTYTITATIYNNLTGYGTCTATASNTIVVGTACTAITAATATISPSSIATGSSSTLNVTGTGITAGTTTFSWAGGSAGSPGGFTATTQNPSTGTLATAGGYSYTVTATNANGTGICTATATTSLTVSSTVVACINPTFTGAAVQVTCTGTTANSDGKLTISGVSNADKVAYSTGATYSGTATYTTATLISALSPTGQVVGNLANPASSQQYTIRVYNGSNTCYTDQTVTLTNKNCTTPCGTPRCGTVTITVNN